MMGTNFLKSSIFSTFIVSIHFTLLNIGLLKKFVPSLPPRQEEEQRELRKPPYRQEEEERELKTPSHKQEEEERELKKLPHRQEERELRTPPHR